MFQPVPSLRCASSCALVALCFFLPAGHARANPITNVFSGTMPQGGTITVTGARDGANYDGEGHVVGSMVGHTFVPLNLQTYNGKPFIINDSPGSNEIKVVFSFPVYSLSFDYEIFPNGDMPDGRGHTPGVGNWPDFTFKADGQTLLHTLALLPGTAGTSTLSVSLSPETAPQFIGSSGLFLFPHGATTFEFIDWPPTIGINNVHFSSDPLATPEPSSVLLFALIFFAGVVWLGRRRLFVVTQTGCA